MLTLKMHLLHFDFKTVCFPLPHVPIVILIDCSGTWWRQKSAPPAVKITLFWI